MEKRAKEMAERAGFEPAVEFDPYDGLANRSFRPLRHLSALISTLYSKICFLQPKKCIFSEKNLIFLPLGGSAKTRDQPFCVLRKSKTGNFSVVTLQAATLKFSVLVFFAIHQKFSTGCFGTAARISFDSHKWADFRFPACKRPILKYISNSKTKRS